MGDLFTRSWVVDVVSADGTERVRTGSETADGADNRVLRVVFDIERDRDRKPDAGEIAIYNLRPETRQALVEEGAQYAIEAGYTGNRHVIFQGTVETGKVSNDGVDWITSAELTDGGPQQRQSRINLSFQPGVSVQEVLQRAAQEIGVGLGNLSEQIASGNLRGALASFGNGLVLSGNAADQFDKLAKSLGYNWSVKNGALQVLPADDSQAIDDFDAIVLSASTGLVGSPQPGEKGIVEARSLLNPRLEPGRVVSLQAREISGLYVIDRTRYKGDSRGNDWYAELELKPR